MGTIMAVAFVNVFMAKMKKKVLSTRAQLTLKSVEYNQNRRICTTGKQLPQNNQILRLKLNIRFRNYVLGLNRHKGEIFNKESTHEVQTHYGDRDLTVHEFCFLSSISRGARILKRRSTTPPKNRLVTLHV